MYVHGRPWANHFHTARVTFIHYYHTKARLKRKGVGPETMNVSKMCGRKASEIYNYNL
jgi:hypothetical protein